MDEDFTSEIIDDGFVSDSDEHLTYEELTTRGFNRLVKVMRQGRWFLLKGLKPDFVQRPMYLDLLRKEYELSIRMDHPNIVKALYKEVNPEIGPCIVMEYVDGDTLEQFLKTNPSVAEKKKVLEQLLDALKYVHGKQIVHRDLKPSNILITRNGHNVKVIDFGLSDADDYALLKQPAGTQKYMAPEQKLPGVKIDSRADIYAFGMLLSEVFPNRYRHIAAKSSRHDRERRYGSVDAVQKAFRHRDLWPRMAMVVIVLGLLVALFFIRSKELARIENKGYSPEFTELLGRAEHIIDSMYNPVLADLDTGKSAQDISLDFVERVKVCRSLLHDIQSPLLDDPKTHDEFVTAWEHLHNEKYNMVCFRLSDRINEGSGQNMNQ